MHGFDFGPTDPTPDNERPRSALKINEEFESTDKLKSTQKITRLNLKAKINHMGST